MTTTTNDTDEEWHTFGNVRVRAVEMDRENGTVRGLELIDGRHTAPVPDDYNSDGLRTKRTLVAIRDKTDEDKTDEDKTDEDKTITLVNVARDNVRKSRRASLIRGVLGEDVGREIDGDKLPHND